MACLATSPAITTAAAPATEALASRSTARTPLNMCTTNSGPDVSLTGAVARDQRCLLQGGGAAELNDNSLLRNSILLHHHVHAAETEAPAVDSVSPAAFRPYYANAWQVKDKNPRNTEPLLQTL
eukprot:SM000050S16974  [mRNA]  locus=s50:128461:132242:- [translate_table: standard]